MSPVTLLSQPAQESKMQPTPEKLTNYQQLLESLEYLLTQFQQNQSENLQVHGAYLNHQMEYAKAFFQLMQQQNALLSESKSTAETTKLKQVVMESLERSMMQFHSQQGETLRIHEQYLQEQLEYTKNFFQLIQQEYSQIISEDGATELTEKFSNGAGHNFIPFTPQTTVTEEAPVPATTKIVEALPSPVTEPVAKNGNGSTHTQAPLPAPKVVEPVVETPVLPQLVQPVVETPVIPQIVQPVVETPVIPQIVQPVIETPVIQIPQSSVPNATIDIVDLDKNLLAITSDKTGYPVEMLEMDMDMEADLGIDSIKRVEILGALQEMYPNLPKPNLEELAEKRTIGQVVEYLQSFASKSVSVEVVIHEVQPVETPAAEVQQAVETPAEVTPEVSVVVAFTPQPEAEPAAATNEFPDLAQTLLAITSDKTGYPVEMLELEMDMEADLGIDSIKRVEILGAMQEMYPNLPKPNIEDLGELRTIGQIVDYLQQLAGGEKKKYESEFVQQPPELESSIQRYPAKLRSLPKPDRLDFTLPEGYITLITDDGSLTTSKLTESLIAEGSKVVVISFPQSLVPQQSPLPAGVTRVTLANLSEEHLQQQLQAIATHCGKVGAFIHLHPVFANNTGTIPYIKEEKAIVKHVFLMAKHLKPALTEAAQHGRSCFCTVAHLDGAFDQRWFIWTNQNPEMGMAKSLYTGDRFKSQNRPPTISKPHYRRTSRPQSLYRRSCLRFTRTSHFNCESKGRLVKS
jgi:acyl carrier protein